MHNLYTNFKHFFTIVGQVFSDQLDSSGNFRFYPRRPKLSDQQVIALTLTAEAMGIDSENYFWGKRRSDYSREFPQLGDRCNFNRRKRLLSLRIHELTVHLSRILNQGQDVFLIDSIPIPICKPARSRGLKICRKDFATAPDKGYSAVSRGFYTGYKLHLVISARGVFHCMDITKASIHDIHYLNDVRGQMAHCTLIGDKGYLNREVKMDLFTSCNIRLETPMRYTQRDVVPFHPVFKRARRRIETLFAQLCDQFMLKRNYAKSWSGLSARVISKIAALTMLQYHNQMQDKPINRLKYAMAGFG